jgi:hypothetical protein
VPIRQAGDTAMAQTYPNTQPPSTEPSGWAIGWTAFAAIMMVVQGFWWLIVGLIAIVNDNFYVAGEEYVFQFDTTTWGWIHLVLGFVIAGAGLGLFGGAVWARTVGVIMAAIAMLVAFAWLPWYPIFAILLIAISVAVIWALTTHRLDMAGD